MTIRELRLPDAFYTTHRTLGGGEAMDYQCPSLVPNAAAYVTDGQQYGIQYIDGYVDWLADNIVVAFGDGAEILN